MSICSLATEAVTGLTSGSGGSLVSNVANVLGVLGAADIGIQIGTGGQAGLFDLPNLLNTPGIDCNGVLVTPIQWYANGMSCDGLVNPDQQRIEREIREFEERQRLREEIRTATGYNPPPGHTNETLRRLREQANTIPTGFDDGSGSPRNGLMFDYDGTAFIKGVTSNYQYSLSYVNGVSIAESTDSWQSNFSSQQPIYRGQTTTSNSVSQSATNTYTDLEGSFSNTTSQKSGFTGIGWGGFALISVSVFLFSSTQAPSKRFTYQNISNIILRNSASTIRFEPVGVPPPGTLIITNIGGGGNPPRDPVSQCNDGNRRRQPMPCSQCNLTPDIIKMIRDLHVATGAGRLAAGTFIHPEREVEKWGTQLYESGGAIAGMGVRCSNLIDVATATAAAPYYRMGLQRFPAMLPESLVNKGPMPDEAALMAKLRSVPDLASFLEWAFKIFEELIGQFPIKYEVTDDGKTNKVDVWNVSEALAEIYGMQVKVVEDSDQSVQWGVRSATEASKAGNAAVKTLHLLNEITDFLGPIKSQGTKIVDCTFNPDPTVGMTTEEMLKPSKQTLMVTDIQDGRSLLGILLNINYWSQVSGRSVFHSLNNNPATGKMQLPGDIIKEEKKKNRGYNKKFDEWKQKRQQPATNIPNDQKPLGVKIPDIKVIQQPDNKL